MQRYSSSSSLHRTHSISEMRVYDTFEPATVEVPVRIKSQDREERAAILNISISMTQVGGTHHQTLNIEVTDEADPFFLFALQCGESEFHTLKQEQAILVDFLTFPHKLVELLEMCARKDEAPKFICTMDRGTGFEANLNIIETNMFKQLTHLSLRLRSANDEIVKKHLAEKLREYKAGNEDLDEKLRHCEESLQSRTAEYYEVSRQLENLKSELDRKLEDRRLQEQEKLTALKEQMLENQSKMQNSYEQEKKSLEEKYDRQLNDLFRKVDTQAAQLSELTSVKYNLESQERENKAKINQLQHELDLANNELDHLRGTAKNLDSTKFEQEKTLTELRLTVQNLERQLKDKEEINQRLQAQLDSNAEYKGHQEETVSMLKSTIAKYEDKLTQSTTEINKGNSIINKLQSELKSYKQKLKLKNTVVLQQEHVIQQKQEQIDSTEKKTYSSQRELDKKNDEITELNRTINELKTKLEEAQKSLQSNSSTIQWLNNRLNEVEKTKGAYMSSYKPSTTTNTPLAFKPSSYAVDNYKTTPRSPFINTTNSQSEDQELNRFLEPIKYREPV